MRKSFVTGIFLLVLTLPVTPQTADDQAQSTVQKVCTNCHDMETVTGNRRTEAGWKETVDDMVSRGADGTPQELAEVVRYLTNHFGKLNLNTATAQQIQDFLSLPEKDANAIVEWRDRKGKFQNLDQLKAVPGIDSAKLQEKRELIAFND